MTFRQRIPLVTLAVLVIAVGAGIVVYVMGIRSESTGSGQSGKVVSLVDESLLNELPKVDRTKADTSHLAKGLTPPTNTWFSGMALQASPEPVFSYPNSFRPTDAGFEMGLPVVSASAESIIGPHNTDLTVRIAQATRYEVSRYDELTVSLSYYSESGSKLATVRIAAGIPYVYVIAAEGVSIDYGAAGAKRADATVLKRDGSTYGVLTDSQVTSFFSTSSDDDFEMLAQYALNVVDSGSVEYRGDDTSSHTALRYKTSNGQPTLIARLPHQRNTDDKLTSASYESILGSLATTAGNSIEYEVPSADIAETLPVERLNASQKSELTEQLKRDVASLPKDRSDTYFGGKQLQRTAQLLLIADQLKSREQVDILKSKLRDRLDRWFAIDGAFELDTKAKTIIGEETSFGADTEVNDHHFHYGYAIYAAAVLGRFDETFVSENKAAINLLVADIANYKPNEVFPVRRNFDAYFGHSWASGTSPFKDGNNQESTSEAMNAWTAVALWGERTQNDTLVKQATWMLANETATAQQYWLSKPDTSGYSSPLASIVWGGKREYKTFFSDDPNPKLAILLLPLNPSMRQYEESIDTSTFDGTDDTKPFGDYLLMANPDATIEQARGLPDSSVDDGNSRTYMYAYIMTKK